jgi:hypothetical protein
MAAHESAKSTELDARTKGQISLDGVGRMAF